MKVTRVSPFSGEEHSMELPITLEEIKCWQGGELVQKVWPELSPDQREFIMTGITPEEWPEDD